MTFLTLKYFAQGGYLRSRDRIIVTPSTIAFHAGWSLEKLKETNEGCSRSLEGVHMLFRVPGGIWLKWRDESFCIPDLLSQFRQWREKGQDWEERFHVAVGMRTSVFAEH